MADIEKLKFRVERLTRLIVEERVRWSDTYNELSEKILVLKDLRLKQAKETESWNIPDELFCPFTARIMEDPVILATGETYDQRFIEEWLNSGNHTCPLTQKVLTNDALTTNRFAQRIISKWCSKHSNTISEISKIHSKCPIFDEAECNILNSLVDNLSSSSLLEKKLAVKGLRILLKRKDSIRAFVGQKHGFIPNLIDVLSFPGFEDDHEVQENVVTALLNLSLLHSNRGLIVDNCEALDLLIKYLSNGSLQTRCNAAAALFHLSHHESNRKRIGELGAIDPLTRNLKQGNLEMKRDTLPAIFRLCIDDSNSTRAVEEGAVAMLFEMIKGEVLVSEALSTLALLAKHKKAAEQIVQLHGAAFLLGIIRAGTSEITKENALSILYSTCVDHGMNLKELREEESLTATLKELSAGGTLRAQRKAKGILERLKETAVLTFV